MKKFVAVLMAVAMLLTMAFAVAEESTVSYYQLSMAFDAEWNTVSIDDLPVFILGIDGASNACCFGTEEETVEGTYEIVDRGYGIYMLYVVLSNGEELVMSYIDGDSDSWTMVDEESGMTMVLFNIEKPKTYYQLAAAADAEGNVVSIEALPVFILGIDGASNACCFGTEEETAEGTYEIVAGEDGVDVLHVVLSTGEEVVMFYDAEDDAWMMIDEESGVSMYLFNIEALYAEAA